MVKAMADGDFDDLGCFAHILQLVLHDGTFSQRTVIDTLAVCRQVVGHFKRSPLAYDHLKTIQPQLTRHWLKQDVSTKWNSTFYMLQVILEQKMALAAYAIEYGGIQQLTAAQLAMDLAGKVVKVLGCVEEITKSISTEAASTSLIIPFIQAFRLTLEKRDDSDRGIRTMKADMLASLNRCYGNIETNTTLTVATLLDPRFKDKFFSKSDTKTTTIEALNSKLS